jgi:hypothetical protein
MKWAWNFALEIHLEASIIVRVKHVAPYIYREEKQLNWKQHAEWLFFHYEGDRQALDTCGLHATSKFITRTAWVLHIDKEIQKC